MRSFKAFATAGKPCRRASKVERGVLHGHLPVKPTQEWCEGTAGGLSRSRERSEVLKGKYLARGKSCRCLLSLEASEALRLNAKTRLPNSVISHSINRTAD